jgi:2-polyprenyl-3-methyl-5-hydroxy-6-metoxy-1,4-benzoquinol methylase
MKLYGKERSDEEIREFVLREYELSMRHPRTRFREMLAIIPEAPGKLALDYGCGWGHYAIELQKKGYSVDAIDLDPNEIAICNHVWGKQEKIRYLNKTITEYEDKKFDLIVSSQVIEHVHNVGNYLSEINRTLKDDGTLVIGLPNIINPRFIIPLFYKRHIAHLKSINERILSSYSKGSDHINGWDPHHFVILMSSMGFKLEEYVPAEGIPFPMWKPFNGRVWFTRLKRFRNFSYTMLFKFSKVAKRRVENYD